MRLNSLPFEGVERSLDALSMRHAAIASNIANINTPGYVQQQVNFEDALTEALQQSTPPTNSVDSPETFDGISITSPHPDVMLSWQPKMTPSPAGPQRLDGNRASVETEISSMAFNSVKYNALAGVIAKDYQLLRTIAQAK